jgi:predicted transcriptional regulator
VAERRGFGALEADVLSALWAADTPLTAGQLAGRLGGDLAYNTVQTVLSRLFAKGAVHREQAGRAHAYRPVLDEAGLAARKMRAVLDRESNSSAVLGHFVDSLSDAEGEVLADLLRRGRPEDPPRR